jgi:hypothetical protein
MTIENEITAPPAIVGFTESGDRFEVEPTMTLSQLRALLQDAAAYERARRAAVVYAAPEAPATAPLTATQTLAAIDVRIPAAPVALGVTEPAEHRRTLAEWLGLLGLAVAGSAFTAMAVLAVTGGPGIVESGITAVGGLAVSLGAAVASSNTDDRNQAQAWAQWTEAHR